VRSTDRKNKRPFCASAPGACPLKPPAPPAGGHATPTALPVHSEARRSATPRSTPDVGHTPQDGGEEGSEGSHRGKASGQAVLESRISMGFETPRGGMSSRNLLCAHVATSPRATLWALGDPIECFLTRTGGSNGRWDGRKVQMPEDPRDHRLVGDGGHDPERTAAAKRVSGHIQSKHTPQQPRPAPARCSSVGLIPTYTPLARRWNDCPAQRTK
jgi:hypothetical protein